MPISSNRWLADQIVGGEPGRQREHAGGPVVVGDGDRDALAPLAHAQHHELARTVGEGLGEARLDEPLERGERHDARVGAHVQVTGTASEYYGQTQITAAADGVRVLWWDTSVCNDQKFKPDQYEQIATLMQPKGGGGTDPDVVPKFMKDKDINPDALVILSDGYMHSNPKAWATLKCPSLWCIMGNDSYKVPHGQSVNLKEA